VSEAVRFYHNALYAPWPIEQSNARRVVRLELIRLLLTHGQTDRARSELLALSADMPDGTSLRLEVAQLFADAGDDGQALNLFRQALEQTPESVAAIAGAGRAAFRLGDYTLARRYVRELPSDESSVRDIREIVELVLSSDPLASRLGSTERRRRLAADLSHTEERLSLCVEKTGGAAADEATALRLEGHTFSDQLARPGILEQDTVEAGVELIDRQERELGRRCGPPTALDQALALIGRAHGADRK
jgi:tetratricopeptide (TPR) repeat protein